MRSLYETLLDRDYEVPGGDLFTSWLSKTLGEDNAYGIEVEVCDDKIVFNPKNPRVPIAVYFDKIAEQLDLSPVKTLVFNGITYISFTKCKLFQGYDISAEDITIVNRNHLTIKDCCLRSAEDLFFGGHKDYKNSNIVLDNTIAYGLSCQVFNSDFRLMPPSQLNINYELSIKDPIKTQIAWLKKHGVPLVLKDFNNLKLDKQTNPLQLIGTTNAITDFIVVRGDRLNYIYKFYNAAPEHLEREVGSYKLDTGWELIVDEKNTK